MSVEQQPDEARCDPVLIGELFSFASLVRLTAEPPIPHGAQLLGFHFTPSGRFFNGLHGIAFT